MTTDTTTETSEHRPERDEDRDVLALDDDVAGKVAEDRDARAGDDHEPRRP